MVFKSISQTPGELIGSDQSVFGFADAAEVRQDERLASTRR